MVRHPATREEVSSSDTLHAVLFDSGRPLLIAPQVAPTTVGRRICLGWNGSAKSAAAVEAAMHGYSVQKRCEYSGLKNISDEVRGRQNFRPIWQCMACLRI